MDWDVAVIGGGLLGCFAARELGRYRLRTAVLEAREDVCTGISRANTAVVYAGYDQRPGTLKAAMCVRAAAGFGALCGELGVRWKGCGSLMVCFGPKGRRSLERKLAQGLQNGVEGLRLLGREEVLALEPNLSPAVEAGLWAPRAGTVLPWELCYAAAENAAANGARFCFNAPVTGLERAGEGWSITAGGGVHTARLVVNCAGLSAAEVRDLACPPAWRIAPTRGEYFVLDPAEEGLVGRVVFCEPEQGKGFTLVPTVGGALLAGPTEAEAGGPWDARTTRSGQRTLLDWAALALPGLPAGRIIRSFGAVRPNPRSVGDAGADLQGFVIDEGAPGLLSFVGIKTPGLTCARELGEYAARWAAGRLGAAENPDFNPRRTPPLRMADLSPAARAEAVARNPAYGAILCPCCTVSEGEVLDALAADPPAVTLDGVKRRTGAGLGRCQGARCGFAGLELLSRGLGVPPDRVTAAGPGTRLLAP